MRGTPGAARPHDPAPPARPDAVRPRAALFPADGRLRLRQPGASPRPGSARPGTVLPPVVDPGPFRPGPSRSGGRNVAPFRPLRGDRPRGDRGQDGAERGHEEAIAEAAARLASVALGPRRPWRGDAATSSGAPRVSRIREARRLLAPGTRRPPGASIGHGTSSFSPRPVRSRDSGPSWRRWRRVCRSSRRRPGRARPL